MNTLRAQATRLTRAGFELALVQCQPKLTPVELSTVLWEGFNVTTLGLRFGCGYNVGFRVWFVVGLS